MQLATAASMHLLSPEGWKQTEYKSKAHITAVLVKQAENKSDPVFHIAFPLPSYTQLDHTLLESNRVHSSVQCK